MKSYASSIKQEAGRCKALLSKPRHAALQLSEFEAGFDACRDAAIGHLIESPKPSKRSVQNDLCKITGAVN
jgi:hypothetical protein